MSVVHCVRVPSSVAILRPPSFPLLAVEGRDGQRLDGAAVDAASIDADSIRMRTRYVERLHPAGGAKKMLRDVGIEGIRRQRFAPGDELEPVRRHDQMQEPKL